MLHNLLAWNMTWEWMLAICIPCLVISALCAIFIIVVIMLQQSNSNGIGSLGGQQDTFYSQNKGKTLESKLRKLTVIAVTIMSVFMVLYGVMVTFVQ